MDGHLATYTIAQAKLHLPSLVRLAEKDGCVELTRRGRPVAVILSIGEYHSLKSPPSNWWEKVQAFRAAVNLRYLLDTNIISEISRPKPHPNVVGILLENWFED